MPSTPVRTARRRLRKPAVLRASTAAFLLAACSAAPAAAQVSAQPSSPASLSRATQLLVVTTADWTTTSGELRRFVRPDPRSPWQAEGGPIPIVVGRTGLAWGVGFDRLAEGAEPHKREGDGKSPAGVFPLGTAFGFAPADSARHVRLPWLQLAATTECVDDTASAHYTKVLDRGAVPGVDWSSSERMREIRVYRLGAVIAYNEAPAVKGRGSCVFLHVWGGPRSHTAGCTAMDAGELEKLLAWLEPAAHPAVIQVPADVYQRLRSGWGLPARAGS
ncbi:MAG: L,D-transpeptidase family protein [Longimicrobiales bacterium]